MNTEREKMSKTASKLWDLLHDVAQFVPVANIDLYERVQSALDEGAPPRKDFGNRMTFWRIDEWDGIQRKYQTLKRQCGKDEAEKLRDQYEFAGKKVRVVEVSHYETVLESA